MVETKPGCCEESNQFLKNCKKIAKVNEIIAFHPFNLRVEDIVDLVNNKASHLSWSSNELVHSIAIICHFQKAAAFINAMGIKTPELIKEEHSSPDLTIDFKKYIIGGQQISNPREIEEGFNTALSYLDFNWCDNAYDILSELFPFTKNIDEEFKLILAMRNNDCDESEDIMRSTEYFTEKIFGYEHDDFDYSKIKKALTLDDREFIKKVMTNPHLMTSKDFENIKSKHSNEEIVHTVMMNLNVKHRLQLVYLSCRLCEAKKHIAN
jgi:hypothetical protein